MDTRLDSLFYGTSGLSLERKRETVLRRAWAARVNDDTEHRPIDKRQYEKDRGHFDYVWDRLKPAFQEEFTLMWLESTTPVDYGLDYRASPARSFLRQHWPAIDAHLDDAWNAGVLIEQHEPDRIVWLLTKRSLAVLLAECRPPKFTAYNGLWTDLARYVYVFENPATNLKQAVYRWEEQKRNAAECGASTPWPRHWRLVAEAFRINDNAQTTTIR